MKLKNAVILSAAFAIFFSGTAFAEEAAEPAAPAEAVEPENMEPPEAVGMPNPMYEYEDVPALERTVGFPVYYLPGNLVPAYHPAEHIFSIGNLVTDIRFISKNDGSELTVRTALIERIGTEDISGYYGEWTQQSAGDVKRTQVYVAEAQDGMRVVRWTAGRFAFAFTIKGIDDTAFNSMIKNFVVIADKFAHKYRNFRLNTHSAKPPAQPENSAENPEGTPEGGDGPQTNPNEETPQA